MEFISWLELPCFPFFLVKFSRRNFLGGIPQEKVSNSFLIPREGFPSWNFIAFICLLQVDFPGWNSSGGVSWLEFACFLFFLGGIS